MFVCSSNNVIHPSAITSKTWHNEVCEKPKSNNLFNSTQFSKCIDDYKQVPVISNILLQASWIINQHDLQRRSRHVQSEAQLVLTRTRRCSSRRSGLGAKRTTRRMSSEHGWRGIYFHNREFSRRIVMYINWMFLYSSNAINCLDRASVILATVIPHSQQLSVTVTTHHA